MEDTELDKKEKIRLKIMVLLSCYLQCGPQTSSRLRVGKKCRNLMDPRSTSSKTIFNPASRGRDRHRAFEAYHSLVVLQLWDILKSSGEVLKF